MNLFFFAVDGTKNVIGIKNVPRGDWMTSNKDKIANYLDTLFKLTPDFKDAFEKRYKILKMIDMIGPVGRRTLSTKIDISERIIRKETDVLKENKLLESTLKGMIINAEGKEVLRQMDEIYIDFKGILKKEELLAKELGVKKVIIAPINASNHEMNLKSIGQSASEYLLKCIKKDMIIGITGGTTVEKVIESFSCRQKKYNNVTVVPARGSLGNKSEYQANTLVEVLANKMGSEYKLLFTPDKLSEDTIKRLKNEPQIKETIDLINNIDTLLFGIGKSETMTKRRSLDDEEIRMINEKGAVAEAFGYYFNAEGEIVYEINTIGIDLYKFKQIKNLIAVAGGVEKVDAILSIAKLDSKLVLVTDENVANEILRRIRRKKNG